MVKYIERYVNIILGGIVVMKKNCYQILKINPGLVSMTYNDDPIQKVIRGSESRDKLAM